MLENLRGIYREHSDHANLEWVLRMRLGLRHEGPDLVRELAEVLGAQARWDEAARLLESWAAGPGRGAKVGTEVLDEDPLRGPAAAGAPQLSPAGMTG